MDNIISAHFGETTLDDDRELVLVLTFKGEDESHNVLTHEAFVELRSAIASIECSLCGGNHIERAHGEPIVTLDHGRDTPEGLLRSQLQAVLNLLKEQPDESAVAFDMQVMSVFEAESSIEDREVDYQWYDNKMDSALFWRYIIVNSADAGMWSIYKKVEDLPA